MLRSHLLLAASILSYAVLQIRGDIMQSGNPVLGRGFEANPGVSTHDAAERMTLKGTLHKTAILLMLCLITATYTWGTLAQGGEVQGLMIGGAIGGLIFALVTAFKPHLAPVTAPIYALLEGLFLGGFSAFMEALYPDIAMQTVMLTFGTAVVMFLGFATGMIQVTARFRAVVMGATGAIMLFYVAGFVLGFFGVELPLIHGTGLMGIGFSLVVVGVAALNLVLDFDYITRAAHSGAPKSREWYGAFALMVTLVWLYIEFLRLLAKLRESD